MKRILTTLCALAVLTVCSVPAFAAEENSSSFYPVGVEEYMENDTPRIRKVYQLALSDDPAQIPVEDFERDGRMYFLLDMTCEDSLGVVTRPHIESITAKSDTDDMQKVLAKLDAEIGVATEDAYTGTLRLDHTSVKVTADGYATKTKSLAATRTYPNLSDADVSLIPKTIQEKGKTLTLADVQWVSSQQTEVDGTVTRYSATANYSGTVARTDCDTVTYTAIFGSVAAPDDYLFGQPTSDDIIYEQEAVNVDRSKNTALIPPTFGSPTSYPPAAARPSPPT